jgi:hypothetical protein
VHENVTSSQVVSVISRESFIRSTEQSRYDHLCGDMDFSKRRKFKKSYVTLIALIKPGQPKERLRKTRTRFEKALRILSFSKEIIFKLVLKRTIIRVTIECAIFFIVFYNSLLYLKL